MSLAATERPGRTLGVRWRLLLAAVALLAATLGAAFLWARHQLRGVLVEQADELLANKARELADVARRHGSAEKLREEIDRETEVYREDGMAVALRTAAGPDLTFANGAGGDAVARLLDGTNPAGTPREFLAGGRRLRGVCVEAATPNGPATIAVAMSLDRAEGTLAAFDRRVALHGLAFLLFAVPGGLLLYRQAVRPVVAAVAAARAISPSDPSARLPTTGAGDEFDALARTVNELLDRVAAHQRQVRRVTADAAHELRTPLAAMRAAAEVALQQGRSAEHYHAVLAGIGEQCERLTAIVESLQLLARADAGELALDRRACDLAALCRETVEFFAPLAEERGVALRLDAPCPVPVRADAPRLRQALSNLIDNALKFTPAGGAATVRATAAAGHAEMEVRDTGPGIAADALPHVFERFYRAGATAGTPGSGLGLAIVRTIVEAHGGAVAALPDRGGACFHVRLPA